MTGLPNGAARRNKGARGERAFAEWLRTKGYAARRYLAGDGRQPGDIDAPGIPGVIFDVKYREECRPGPWMTATEKQAKYGELPIVVYPVPGVTDPGQWVWMIRAHEGLELVEMLASYDKDWRGYVK